MIPLLPHLTPPLHFTAQDVTPTQERVFTDTYDAFNRMVGRISPDYPIGLVGNKLPSLLRESWEVAGLLNNPMSPNVRPDDFAFLETRVTILCNSYAIADLLTNIRTGYKTRIGYTPTLEVDQTPDNHWAKISLDLLYKQGIFKGER